MPQRSERGIARKADLHGEVLVPGAVPALPAHLEAARRTYRAQSRSPRTLEAYARACGLFTRWCAQHGRQPLPAAPETIEAWIVALAHGDGEPPRSRATIDQYLSAVVWAHRKAGHALDRKHPLIAETWAGICRNKAKVGAPRKATPIMADDLRKLIDALTPQIPAATRDAALLSLGWAAALRRSELVGLDWQKQGSGTGFVRIEDRGLSVTLLSSKGSQTAPVVIICPRADMKSACEALERWADKAALEPGQPVFRAIDKGQHIGADRLTDRSVSRIIKARVRELAQAGGKTRQEAEEMVELISGHSLRAGYATTAGAADMPEYRIREHTRHKSAEVLQGYIRAGQQWTKSGLKGIGF